MAARHLNCANSENLDAKFGKPGHRHPNILSDIKNVVTHDELVRKTEKLSLVSGKETRLRVSTAVTKEKESKLCPKTEVGCNVQDSAGEAKDKAFPSSLIPLAVPDIDAGDEDNPQLLSEYVKDIFNYLRELECRFPVHPNFMKKQPDLTPRMRYILVDWMVEVHQGFKLLPETLYLAVYILDHFLQEVKINRTKLQLVGITSLFIASKYEEVWPPEVRKFTGVTDNTYTKEEVFKMEKVILKTLDYRISGPITLNFIRRNSKAAGVTGEMHMLSKYLAELCLVEYEMCAYKPSLIAASATYLSLKLLSKENSAAWTPILVFYTKYAEEQLCPVVEKLHKLLMHQPNSKYQAVRNKYASPKFMEISLRQFL